MCLTLLCCAFSLPWLCAGDDAEPVATAENTELKVSLDDEKASFTLGGTVKFTAPGEVCILDGAVSVSGDVKIKSRKEKWYSFSRPSAKLNVVDGKLFLSSDRAGTVDFEIPFYAKTQASGSRRNVAFTVIKSSFSSAQISLAANNNLVEFPSAVITDEKTGAVSALLRSGAVAITWEKIPGVSDASLLSFSTTSIVAVESTAVMINTFVEGKIYQGTTKTVEFSVPESINLLAVEGTPRIEQWNIEKNVLKITFGLPVEKSFALQLKAESALAELPCRFTLRPLLPMNAARNLGRLIIGSSPGLKCSLQSLNSLMQTNENPSLLSVAGKTCPVLRDPLYFNSVGDYSAEFKVESIVPVFSANSVVSAEVKDDSLQIRNDVKLEVRDAFLKEVEITFDSSLNFSRVVSDRIRPADYEIKAGKTPQEKILTLQFTPEVMGEVDFSLYFERELKNVNKFGISAFRIMKNRASRGMLIFSAERGLSLQLEPSDVLNPVHPNSLPRRVAQLQGGYAFHSEDWKVGVTVVENPRQVSGEVFHLISAGEGTAYGSSLFTLNMSGAPTDKLQFRIHKALNNLDFRGAELTSRRQVKELDKDFNLWEITFKQKRSGLLNILATYETPLQETSTVPAGAVSCVEAENTPLFIAVSGLPGRFVEPIENSESFTRIDDAELPEDYRSMITNQLLAAYRGIGQDAWRNISLKSYSKAVLPQLLIERSDMVTRYDTNGAAETTCTYTVKNTNSQFIKFKLPEGSRLWDVTVNGKRARTSQNEREIMVPVPRYPDVNTPIGIQITYVQNFPESIRSTEITLAAPESNAKTLAGNWKLQVPDTLAISGSVPAAQKRSDTFRPGLVGVLSKMLTLTKRFPHFYSAGILFVVATLLISHGIVTGRKLTVGLGAFFGLLFVIGAVVMCIAFVTRYGTGRGEFLLNTITINDFSCLTDSTLVWKVTLVNILTQKIIAFIVLGLGIAALVAAFFLRHKRLAAAISGGAGAAMILYSLSQFQTVFFLLPFALFGIGLLAVAAILNIIMIKHWRKTVNKVSVLLFCLGLVWAGNSYAEGKAEDSASGKNPCIVESFELNINVGEKNVEQKSAWSVKCEEPALIWLVPDSNVLLRTEMPKNTQIVSGHKNDSGAAGWSLKILKDGDFEFNISSIALLSFGADERSFSAYVPPCLKSSVKVTVPSGFKLESGNAVCMTSSGGVYTVAPPVGGGSVTFKLIPAQTDEAPEIYVSNFTELFYSRGTPEFSMNSTVSMPKGEIMSLVLSVPSNASVSEVVSKGLASWNFDKAAGKLTLYYNDARRKDFQFQIFGQVTINAKTGETSYSEIKVDGAARQSGTIGVCASADIQLSERSVKNANPVSTELYLAQFRTRNAKANIDLKRAYRYSKPDCELAFQIEHIKSELRVNEDTVVRYDDDRILRSGSLDIEIVKGGVFSVELILPKGFELNSIKGKDLSYWNEQRDDSGNCLTVNFKNQITKNTRLDIELSKLAASAYKLEQVPVLKVRDAAKHTGTLMISADKGTTLSVADRNGVAPMIGNAVSKTLSSLNFKILSPDWNISLKFASAVPWIQVVSFQKINMKLNKIEFENTINLTVENNSIRSLLVEVPSNVKSVEFEGALLASAKPVSGNGWKLEFKNRIEKSCRLKASGIIESDADKGFTLSGWKFPEAGGQTGYASIYPENSLSLQPPKLKGEIIEQDSRNLPVEFIGTQPAVASFRMLGSNYEAKITSVSNASAQLIKGSISAIEFASLLSERGGLVTKVFIELNNADGNFLSFTLPEGATCWGARVGNMPVEVLYSGKNVMIPLEDRNVKLKVEFSYAQTIPDLSGARKYVFNGPKFNLPLKNIVWRFYLPEDAVCSKFGGTLTYRESLGSAFRRSIGEGAAGEEVKFAVDKANYGKILEMSKKLSQSGRNKEAEKMIQSAILFSSDQSVRDDLQGYMLESNRGLNAARMSNRAQAVSKGVSKGQDFSAQQQQPVAQQAAVPQQQMQEDSEQIRRIVDQIFTQQQAVLAPPQNFNLNIPVKGQMLIFQRDLEITDNAPLSVAFSTRKAYRFDYAEYVAFALFGLLFAGAIGFLIRPSVKAG